MSTIFRAKAYLQYWLAAVDEHSLHSPFFYDLFTQVIKRKPDSASFQKIESHREKLLSDIRSITVKDLGSGSTVVKGSNRKIADIARTSLSTPHYSSLYHRLISTFQATEILELGTSLGITTLYLAQHKNVKVTTFEGSPEIAAIARSTFALADASIKLIEGNLDNTLPHFLQSTRRIDFVLMDANHRYAPTVKYFQWLVQRVHHRSLIVLDDIHASEEMQRAWHEIRQHNLVYGTVDLFRCGLLFFDPALNKQHLILQF